MKKNNQTFKVFSESCKNCLLSADAIVSFERRKEIIQSCLHQQTHFICHKASIKGENVCCKTFYDSLGQHAQVIRIAERLDIIEFVEQTDTERLPSYLETSRFT